jgi:hypothetical protein
MERKEGAADPFREATERLYHLAKRIDAAVFCPEGGKYHVQKDGMRAEVAIDSTGRVSYDLFDEDVHVLSSDNTDLDTIIDNVRLRDTTASLKPSEARVPLHKEKKLRQASGPGKIEVDNSSDLEKAA